MPTSITPKRSPRNVDIPTKSPADVTEPNSGVATPKLETTDNVPANGFSKMVANHLLNRKSKVYDSLSPHAADEAQVSSSPGKSLV